ncbi:tryptophan 7-halogenase [Roseofilum capinflatum]|uniref:Tryptophan 7-halogenase n=1 Tax=Roseofilum capinflatum BLCC-M114 TaxID=3022440 RepID=A0ABT7B5A2_9CYAN|nr:tryptophan 7-halogenase [Roseofilum capinflatum]MDJ1174355.1 tryptophan 7-halogenase [Roseofilum capinflatum BLCC-M114]
MKIAVIGGGTAGFVAAAHLSKYFPTFDLYHIYDPNIPIIGVGEGTTAIFRDWLQELTGLSDLELVEQCFMTRKYGIKFENWGTQHQSFFHHFCPLREEYAYHLSSEEIVKLLDRYVSATSIHKKVIALESDGMVAKIEFSDRTHLDVDFAIDARGLPKTLGDEHIKVNIIPTNAALLRQCPAIPGGIVDLKINGHPFEYNSATRAIARPHGWIFMIPLTHRTSYGYIYNHLITSIEDVTQDFDIFLDSEGVTSVAKERQLTFPNFTCRSFFDGAVFRIGNTASFLEPLEATAIVWILVFMRSLSVWPLRQLVFKHTKPKLKPDNLQRFNQILFNHLMRTALFIGWHYSMGSRFESEFWKFAQSNYQTELKKFDHPQLLNEFEQFCQLGQNLPHPLTQHQEFVAAAAQQCEDQDINFSMFTTSGFAEMGYGIGYF